MYRAQLVRAKGFAALGTSFLLVLSAACRRTEKPFDSAPTQSDGNILLITLDTTRADRLSCYAGPKPAEGHAKGAKTPHLDALSARGVLFAHATAQVPLTLPSHASIMTGEYSTLHNLRGMEGLILNQSHQTLGSITR